MFHLTGRISSRCAQITGSGTGWRRAGEQHSDPSVWRLLSRPNSSPSRLVSPPIKPAGFLMLTQVLWFGGATSFHFPKPSERGWEGRSPHPGWSQLPTAKTPGCSCPPGPHCGETEAPRRVGGERECGQPAALGLQRELATEIPACLVLGPWSDTLRLFSFSTAHRTHTDTLTHTQTQSQSPPQNPTRAHLLRKALTPSTSLWSFCFQLPSER